MSARLTTLANGMRVATDRMDGFRSAAVAVHVQVGGRHESAVQNGVAHFLEHMAFKGTKTRSALEISRTIEHVGGYLNACTGKEFTSYYAGGLGQDVPLAIELISDIILESELRPEDIELERGVILNEIGEYEDSPSDALFDALQRTAYPDQPFGWPIIGTADRVAAFNRTDIRGFVDEHYRAGRMILAAAGDVDHRQVTELAEQHFGRAAIGGRTPPEPSRFSAGQIRIERDIEQAHLALAFEAPPLLDPREPAARILAITLGGGSSSRLFAEARERRGLCYSIGASMAPSSDTGTLIIYASTGRDELAGLAEICVDELRKSTETLTAGEVEKARNQIRVGMVTANENAMNRIERMGGMVATLGRIESIDETIGRYDSVTLAEVQEFAAEIAGKGEAAMAVLGQVDKAPDVEALLERLVR